MPGGSSWSLRPQAADGSHHGGRRRQGVQRSASTCSGAQVIWATWHGTLTTTRPASSSTPARTKDDSRRMGFTASGLAVAACGHVETEQAQPFDLFWLDRRGQTGLAGEEGPRSRTRPSLAAAQVPADWRWPPPRASKRSGFQRPELSSAAEGGRLVHIATPRGTRSIAARPVIEGDAIRLWPSCACGFSAPGKLRWRLSITRWLPRMVRRAGDSALFWSGGRQTLRRLWRFRVCRSVVNDGRRTGFRAVLACGPSAGSTLDAGSTTFARAKSVTPRRQTCGL